MSTALIFPDGIRLSTRQEIPGPEPVRSDHWARIQSASIVPGFVLKQSADERFTHYAEINVDAPHIWRVFSDLCNGLLGPDAALLFSEIDLAPVVIGSSAVASILATLEPHQYQLAHDGFLQFGLVSDADGRINEVFVAPTKHFMVWLNDESRFRSVMERHDLREAEALEFLDQYPRTTVKLPAGSVTYADLSEFVRHLEGAIAAERR